MVPAKHWRSRVAQTLSGSAADGFNAYFFGKVSVAVFQED